MYSLLLLLTSSLQSSLWQKLSIFTCLHFFQAVAVLQTFQGNFKDLVRVGLAVLKIIIF